MMARGFQRFRGAGTLIFIFRSEALPVGERGKLNARENRRRGNGPFGRANHALIKLNLLRLKGQSKCCCSRYYFLAAVIHAGSFQLRFARCLLHSIASRRCAGGLPSSTLPDQTPVVVNGARDARLDILQMKRLEQVIERSQLE